MKAAARVMTALVVLLLSATGTTWAQTDESDGSIPRAVREADRLERALLDASQDWTDEALLDLAFGLPTRADRDRALRAERPVLERVRKSRTDMARLMRAIEAAGGLNDPVERDALSRALLIEAVSLPILEARSLLMIGLAEDATLGRAPESGARASLEAAVTIAGKVESASPWADVERGLVLGVGLTALGDYASAQRSLDDAEDALREDPLLADPAYGLAQALSLARAAWAFQREADTSKASDAAQRRLRDVEAVPEAMRSALSLRLLVARAGDPNDQRARVFLAGQLDEVARAALASPAGDDAIVIRQLARVAQVTDLQQGSRWMLGAAVGTALALDAIPRADARARTAALTILLEREREAMGPYAVLVLSALAEALGDCVKSGDCNLDLAMHVAQRAVEARPMHDATRASLERLCRGALESESPLSSAASAGLQVLVAHTHNAPARDALCCQGVIHALESTPEAEDRSSVLDACARADGLIDALEFASSAAATTLLYVCDRLAFDMEHIEREALEGPLLPEQEALRQALAERLVQYAERFEDVRVDGATLDEARVARAYGLLALGDVANALELTRQVTADAQQLPDPFAGSVHLRALLANDRLSEARAWFEEKQNESIVGSMLAAALTQTRALWIGGPELTQSFDQASLGALPGADQRTLALVMQWAVAQGDRWSAPEAALRRGLGWLIAMQDPLAPALTRAWAAHPGGDAATKRERLVLASEAMLSAGDDAGAFALLREVVEAVPPESRRERTYWHASVRIVEILQRQNQNGSRTPTIMREIQRLRLQPTWGSFADCTSAIERIASALGMAPGTQQSE